MVPALNQQIGMQTHSFTQQWHYVMQCFRDDTIVNWSDPGLISLCLNPLRCGGVGGRGMGRGFHFLSQTSDAQDVTTGDWLNNPLPPLSQPWSLPRPTSGENLHISSSLKIGYRWKQELRGSSADAALAPSHLSLSSLWFVVLHTHGSLNSCTQRAISACNSLIKPLYIVQQALIYHNPVRNVTMPA